MSGATAIRGFLVQALATLLAAVTEEFSALTVEPNVGEDQIDFLIETSSGARAVQVKSSQNLFSLAQATKWAEALEAGYPTADRYELLLFGPHSQDLRKHRRIGSVEVSPPRELNLPQLIGNAAHQLDLYLERVGISQVPPLVRELIVTALSTHLLELGTSGSRISSEELADQILRWVLLEYPPAIEVGTTERLHLMADTMVLGPEEGLVAVGLRATFVSSSTRAVIVDDIFGVLRTPGFGREMRAAAWIDDIALRSEVEQPPGQAQPYQSFAVASGSIHSPGVLIFGAPEPIRVDELQPGEWSLAVHVAYHRVDTPLLETELSFEVGEKACQQLLASVPQFVRTGRDLRSVAPI